MSDNAMCSTYIIPVDSINPPEFDIEDETGLVAWWKTNYKENRNEEDPCDPWHNFYLAAHSLDGDVPVAFPTETVYGLGADATRQAAVLAIYRAKNRPADNPLIVHISSLPQLRRLMGCDVPDVYKPLIQKFWPGPLTILLPLPIPSPFAPAVSNRLSTVGIRMPRTRIARLLISIADKPLAAPSANTSTKPSPTTAQHVKHDMNRRIRYILDGGPCEVGLESTVVDGLHDPPLVLRPGGVSIEKIRACAGKWTNVQYSAKLLDEGPQAPGMKYRHYAPSGRVLLFEAGVSQAKAATKLCYHLFHKDAPALARDPIDGTVVDVTIGVVTTTSWEPFLGIGKNKKSDQLIGDIWDQNRNRSRTENHTAASRMSLAHNEEDVEHALRPSLAVSERHDWPPYNDNMFYSIATGKTAEEVAHLMFAALRKLELLSCDIIVIEGISEESGELAASVMNRLRKAAAGE